MFCYIVNGIYLSYILGWSRDNATTEYKENDLLKITIGENRHYKIKIGIFDSTIQGSGCSAEIFLLLMHILSCLLNIITYCLVDIWFSKIILAYLLYTFASFLVYYMVLQVLADKNYCHCQNITIFSEHQWKKHTTKKTKKDPKLKNEKP